MEYGPVRGIGMGLSGVYSFQPLTKFNIFGKRNKKRLIFVLANIRQAL